MMRMLSWAIAGACRIMLMLAVAAGASLTAFVMLSAIMRYFVGAPFRFTEELVGLLFCAFIFLTFPFITLHSRHISVALVADFLPSRLRTFNQAISSLLIVVFAAAFGKSVYEYVAFSYRVNATAEMSGLILYPWMALMPVAMLFVGLIALGQTAKAISRLWNPPREDEGEDTPPNMQ